MFYEVHAKDSTSRMKFHRVAVSDRFSLAPSGQAAQYCLRSPLSMYQNFPVVSRYAFIFPEI
ncbi:MAG TPA: hypothetical protein V6C85_19935 [Allocoleopsis sp.]